MEGWSGIGSSLLKFLTQFWQDVFKSFSDVYKTLAKSFAFLYIGQPKAADDENGTQSSALKDFNNVGKILFGTQKGNSRRLALLLARKAKEFGLELQAVSMADFEVEKLQREELLFVILSTYTDGKPPDDANWFCRWLEESAHDFRCGSDFLKNVHFGVFGCGNSQYGDNFNKCSNTVRTNLRLLGAHEAVEMFQGDEDKGSLDSQMITWCKAIHSKLFPSHKTKRVKKVAIQKKVNKRESAASDEDVDIEDLGAGSVATEDGEKPEMLSATVRASLTKQGYKVVGSHSGVKLCRWTKSMLRGRGGCYKHSFYGIESHRCMETTPSLACANKCVFCWRHHTNPVGKEWKWKMDPPKEIVDKALSYHRKMIKEMKGVPGVKEERLAEGIDVKHCALSLVGEPIMYPEINTICDELHKLGISSFLVTNAQFPSAIENLVPVTQLYVSVDAATKDSLKAIDRPLHSDFWERFLLCLQKLRDKKQRTVYRLTLVKDMNVEDIEKYAELVDVGKPDFIEIKGVTYCGTSDASSLTMKNVPYHEEVKSFGEKLCSFKGEYGLACEHEHSLCILLARKDRFFKGGKWHTWIDYEKFQSLYHSGQSFGGEDYMQETPHWAVYGSDHKGFDPAEERFRKVRNHPNSKKEIAA
mmetsp:Transcript_9613/g.24662  ORF Transcript_9613/g.24662 Transcript_9613/m.24662 type:complete len:643 (+) Transcript_9613:156-2084(+)